MNTKNFAKRSSLHKWWRGECDLRGGTLKRDFQNNV